MCVCVCACVRACVCLTVRAFVCAGYVHARFGRPSERGGEGGEGGDDRRGEPAAAAAATAQPPPLHSRIQMVQARQLLVDHGKQLDAVVVPALGRLVGLVVVLAAAGLGAGEVVGEPLERQLRARA